MKKNKIRKISVLVVVVLLVIFASLSLFSFARYVGSSIWDYYLESNEFYFYSNQLNDDVNIMGTWNGGSVAFELLNYNEANEVTQGNINYELECKILNDSTGNLSCGLNGTTSSTYTGSIENIKICRNDTEDSVDTSSFNEETCSTRGYTWIEGNSSLVNFFEVVSSDSSQEIEYVEVEITAKSTSPYSKTLTGEFHLTKVESPQDIFIEHETYSTYEKLIISNHSAEPIEYILRWDASKLRISKGEYYNESYSSIGYINEVVFKVEKGQTIDFDFYKTNASDTITIDDFILVEPPKVREIKVTSINLIETSAGVTELSNPTYIDDSISMHLNLPSNSSTFSYEVTIENTTLETYYLKEIVELVNTSGINFVPYGLSLYHEFDPGTKSIFYINYNGYDTLLANELILELEFIFEQGEVYEDETLNGATPEIIDGLIPIDYNDSTGMWQKADVINGEWYDYSIQKWANAASVIASQRDYYAAADPGTPVELDHMTAMLVWIPRHSYTIKDSNGYHGYGGDAISRETPGAINIKFIGADELDTGSAEYSSEYPENYYTSAAFCWGNTCDDPATRSDEGNDEIPGFWIAKFEASTVNNLLYSKPNMRPAVHETIYETFSNVQSLMNGTNGYNNYGYVGFVDAHLIKNTEWGTISYLSQSKYGKYGNTAYTGANKEIYINNCSSYITGIGGSTPTQGSTTATCYTNTYDTYNGMGASTTGNIYGVYDMVGGTFDRVMGIILDSNGNFISDYSGFSELPEGRYINIYPYDTYSIGDISPIKGDALTETINYYSDRYLGDPRFSSTNYYLYHWLYRGGSLFFSNTDANGIFSYTLFNGQADGHHSSRFTITMYGSIVEHLY